MAKPPGDNDRTLVDQRAIASASTVSGRVKTAMKRRNVILRDVAAALQVNHMTAWRWIRDLDEQPPLDDARWYRLGQALLSLGVDVSEIRPMVAPPPPPLPPTFTQQLALVKLLKADAKLVLLQILQNPETLPALRAALEAILSD